MKIVEIAEFYSEQGGGVRTYTRQKLNASARLGHETVIIAPGAENREQVVPGGKIVWVKAPRLIVDPRYHMFATARGVHAVIDREAPDVLVGASPWKGGWSAADWQPPAGMSAPLKVLFMHADPMAVYAYTLLGGIMSRPSIDRLFGGFWRYLARLSGHFDATLVGGAWLARRFDGFGLHRVMPVPFGVELSVFNPARRDEALRTEMLRACDLPSTATLVLNVGRHHPEKRLHTLIKAVGMAQRQREIGLYMVGDGLIRPLVRHWAGCGRHIHLAGQVDDRERLAAIMASADVLLHGSAAETYGRVLAEALASGLPIVVPDQGGAADFAGPKFAHVYRTGDAAAAANALLGQVEQQYAPASAAAAEYARTVIGGEGDHFVRLYACFADLLTRKRAAAGGISASVAAATTPCQPSYA